MKDLLGLLAQLGITGATTYIQSGNVIFRAQKSAAARLPGTLKAAIERQHGFVPEVVVFSRPELADAIAANPYPGANADPKSLHLAFLSAVPKSPDLEALEKLRKDTEQFQLR